MTFTDIFSAETTLQNNQNDSVEFGDLLDAHVQWKRGFGRLVHGGLARLNSSIAERCLRMCPLTQWLASAEGQSMATDRAVRELAREHAQFASACNSILQRLKQGERAQAQHEMKTGSYARHALRLVRVLLAMQAQDHRQAA